MIQNKKQFILYTTVFVCAQIILGHFIQNSPSSFANSLFSLAAIALPLGYVALSLEKTTQKILMLIAFSATLAADFFLSGLVTFEERKLVAMCFFSVVQACYFGRLYQNQTSKKEKIVHVSVRGGVILFAILLEIIVLKDKTNALSVISIFYYANLIVNLIFAFIQVRLSILFPLGLVFFLLCDTVVGLSEMSLSFIPIEEGSLLDKIIHPGVNLAWIFYVPSQTLLAISTNENKG